MFKFCCEDCGECWYIGNPRACKCPDEESIKEWLAWYLSPPENWNEKYGDAFKWTEQEKVLMQQLKEKNT